MEKGKRHAASGELQAASGRKLQLVCGRLNSCGDQEWHYVFIYFGLHYCPKLSEFLFKGSLKLQNALLIYHRLLSQIFSELYEACSL